MALIITSLFVMAVCGQVKLWATRGPGLALFAAVLMRAT